jgi:pyruvate,orthophosphate dikinase
MDQKYVYTFGNKEAEGNKEMKILLGGKGANLAEMNLIGLPVPAGFTISTEACNNYYKEGREVLLDKLKEQVDQGIKYVEKISNKKFGDPKDPLLLSVRSGARVSMPGMMDTVLNIGLNEGIVEGFALETGNPRLAWDSYRRFIQMYGGVVMGMKPLDKNSLDPFEEVIENLKEAKGVELDTDLSTDDLKEMVFEFKKAIKNQLQKELPESPMDQLWGAIVSVFDSWMNERAFHYRKIHDIPHDWGTAVNVQVMVFGNTGKDSATGVAFTRDPSTGENLLSGEYLVDAQGEDVVAGVRTPQIITLEGSRRWAQLSGISESDRLQNFPSMEEIMPDQQDELQRISDILEAHYGDMQDLEFTVERGKLFILQTRNGKRTGAAMVRIGIDMLNEGLIESGESIMSMIPEKLDELLHPIFNQEELDAATEIARGLPASPGAASGQIVFFAGDVEKWHEAKKETILVRVETSPEDIKGMHLANGILTSRGGMTSHAAVVARGMGKCCVSGAGTVVIDYRKRQLVANGRTFKEGDWISLNGTTGQVFEGKIKSSEPEIGEHFNEMLRIADDFASMGVRTNADTVKESITARKFGATGIGLCRTEHMFFEGERIKGVREMILAENKEERQKALDKLLIIQREDFEGIMEVMHDLPVTFRLLDPPMHEFLPHDEESEQILADDLGLTLKEVTDKVEALHEQNPMLGHRGVRLANTYPEITEMQTRAILEAALNLQAKGINALPEVMVPLTSLGTELKMQLEVIKNTMEKVFEERNMRIDMKVGTMIEVPRAVLIAEDIGGLVDFFSFGTNDLTQMTFGYSRDDIGKFLPIYLNKGILKEDPFQTIDEHGVGQLVRTGTRRGKRANPNLKVGVCGEHGGDPASIRFFNRIGLHYVSCSPYRVPIARLVAAQAQISQEEGVVVVDKTM